MKQKKKKQTPLAAILEKRGMKIATWAKSRGLSENDILILRNMAIGDTKGKRGRAKELKELLIKEKLWKEAG